MTRTDRMAPREAHEPELESFVSNVMLHPRLDTAHQLRIVEALLFASAEPLARTRLPNACPRAAMSLTC
jgi:hypothetical protein